MYVNGGQKFLFLIFLRNQKMKKMYIDVVHIYMFFFFANRMNG